MPEHIECSKCGHRLLYCKCSVEATNTPIAPSASGDVTAEEAISLLREADCFGRPFGLSLHKCDAIAALIEQLQRQIERYEESLKVYADTKNWTTEENASEYEFANQWLPQSHGYELAQQALKGE